MKQNEWMNPNEMKARMKACNREKHIRPHKTEPVW